MKLRNRLIKRWGGYTGDEYGKIKRSLMGVAIDAMDAATITGYKLQKESITNGIIFKPASERTDAENRTMADLMKDDNMVVGERMPHKPKPPMKEFYEKINPLFVKQESHTLKLKSIYYFKVTKKVKKLKNGRDYKTLTFDRVIVTINYTATYENDFRIGNIYLDEHTNLQYIAVGKNQLMLKTNTDKFAMPTKIICVGSTYFTNK